MKYVQYKRKTQYGHMYQKEYISCLSLFNTEKAHCSFLASCESTCKEVNFIYHSISFEDAHAQLILANFTFM